MKQYNHLLILLFTSLFVLPGISQDYEELIKLLNPDIPEIYTGEFGFSTAMDGEWAVIGAPRGGGNSFNSGMVVLYKKNNTSQEWEEFKRIVPSDGEDFDYFGSSVDIHNNRIIVGAFREDSCCNRNEGTAYIFEKDLGGTDNWGEVTRINGSSVNSNNEFGFSVSIYDDVAVVGTPKDQNGTRQKAGSAYVFHRNLGGPDNWGEMKQLIASDDTWNGEFGYSVSVHDDVIFVGAKFKWYNGLIGSGSVYIFQRDLGGADNWGELKKIVSDDIDRGDWFGSSIDISGDVAIIGAPNRSDLTFGSRYGTAYIFAKDEGGPDNWGQVKKLLASTVDEENLFGMSVSLDGNRAVVGASGNFNVFDGSAYVFEKDEGGVNNWGEVKEIKASNAMNGVHFGHAVAIQGNDIFVGAWEAEFYASGTDGRAYIYTKDEGGIDNWGEVDILSAGIPGRGEDFGTSVDVSGDIAVVSVIKDNLAQDESGAVFVYGKEAGTDNWNLIKKLKAGVPGTDDRSFGRQVAIDGDRIIVGAPGITPSDNAAYIFERNFGGLDNWGEVRKILSSDYVSWAESFGTSVDIEGDYAIVGATGVKGATFSEGAVYVFHRNQGGTDNWGEVKKITAADAVAGFNFGKFVSISNGYIFSVAWGERSFYIYKQDLGGPDNWGELKKITSIDGVESFGFWNPAVDNNLAIIGAPTHNSFKGAAYVLEKDEGGIDNWGMVHKLMPNDLTSIAKFGQWVDLKDDYAIVGAPDFIVSALRKGSVYMFKQDPGLNTWSQIDKELASDGQDDMEFGRVVAISGPNAIVSSRDNDLGGGSGSAYIFGESSCVPDLSISDDPIEDNIFVADLSITSDGVVPSGGDVGFVSQMIILDPDFEVEFNSLFEILIGQCN